ncbi:homoserine kinase [Candidatus Tremblaya phenacola PAVE]|nr:homoserine kinase [Candidatus Tremblaya phenacola PAVE]
MAYKILGFLVVRWVINSRLGTLANIMRTPLGSVNANFFLETTQTESVITFFLQEDIFQLTSCFCLMQFLTTNQLPSPILYCYDVMTSAVWKHNLVSIVTKLVGSDEVGVGIKGMRDVGRMLSAVHLVGLKGRLFHSQTNDATLIQFNVQNSIQHLPMRERCALELKFTNLLFQTELGLKEKMRSGLCHCDLFSDNLTFKSMASRLTNRLVGCLDFYFSGLEAFIIDIGIAAVASALGGGRLLKTKAGGLLHSYQTVRPFGLRERRFWKAALQLSSFKFWALRLFRFYKLKTLGLLNTYDPKILESNF